MHFDIRKWGGNGKYKFEVYLPLKWLARYQPRLICHTIVIKWPLVSSDLWYHVTHLLLIWHTSIYCLHWVWIIANVTSKLGYRDETNMPQQELTFPYRVWCRHSICFLTKVSDLNVVRCSSTLSISFLCLYFAYRIIFQHISVTVNANSYFDILQKYFVTSRERWTWYGFELLCINFCWGFYNVIAARPLSPLV